MNDKWTIPIEFVIMNPARIVIAFMDSSPSASNQKLFPLMLSILALEFLRQQWDSSAINISPHSGSLLHHNHCSQTEGGSRGLSWKLGLPESSPLLHRFFSPFFKNKFSRKRFLRFSPNLAPYCKHHNFHLKNCTQENTF